MTEAAAVDVSVDVSAVVVDVIAPDGPEVVETRATGPQGPAGPQGATGADGASATVVADIEIDFGGHPGANEAQAVVTGQAGILAGAKVSAFISGDSVTADHTASDHRYAAALVALSGGAVVAGTGFTVYARSVHKMTGKFYAQATWIN